jgi:catechol 2,3-dioxygenase-like lactoylglutathione lyase family enzyme
MNAITFDHVLIVARDLELSIEFYSLIGFEHLETIQRPNDRVAVMRLGDVKVELMNLPDGEKLTDLGFRHIGIKVDDLTAVYERLKDKISFVSPPRKIAGRGNRMTVFFKDPDGVEMHFVQE